jgi:tyrosyl-tRNA synthetase
MRKNSEKRKQLLIRGVEKIVDKENLLRSLKTKRKLRVKLGIDPTSSKLHLGNAVVLRKLKAFQELGHKIVLIFGDFTARVGDPSSRVTGRPALSPQQIRQNLRTYQKQASKIINLRKTEIRFNSEWFEDKKFAFFLDLGKRFTLSQLIEREDIQKRMKKKQPVSFIEVIYPLLQGYDSVMVKADIELGGLDQTLNLLSGREVQKFYNQKPQNIITLRYLVGLDGKKKMSKTYNNTINLEDAPGEIFGKIMSIKDDLIHSYTELLTDLPLVGVNKSNARNLKLKLAHEVVKEIYSEEKAAQAKENFVRTFVEGKAPTAKKVKIKKGRRRLTNLLFEIGAVPSKSEAQRLIRQKAVEINGKHQVDWRAEIKILKTFILKVGKHRFYKVIPK